MIESYIFNIYCEIHDKSWWEVQIIICYCHTPLIASPYGVRPTCFEQEINNLSAHEIKTYFTKSNKEYFSCRNLSFEANKRYLIVLISAL